MTDVNVGNTIESVVGSNAEIFSIGGSNSHQAQLCAGLSTHGVTVSNGPQSMMMEFALANARGYAPTRAQEIAQPSRANTLQLRT